MKDYFFDFGDRLKELKEEAGVTYTKLAKITGYARKTPMDWVKGVAIPNALAVRKLAEFFGVSADYLLAMTDDRTPK